MSIVIETSQLSRVYQTYQKPEGLINSVRGFWNRKYIDKVALSPTDLKIESGKIVGLVGANGAGKTTLLKILSGLITPSSGTAEVLGFKPWERDYRFLSRISILLGQKNQLWWDISPLDSYALLAKIYGLDVINARQRVQELAKMLQCEHVLEVQLRRLSLGERMKMEIIGAILHEPDVLFLDEPTIGLDIVAQDTIRDFLQKYVKNKGPTVILTSHYMNDIAQLADRLLLISHGSMVYDGTVNEFVKTTQLSQLITVRFSDELTKDFQLNENQILSAGHKEFQIKVTQSELGQSLAILTTLGTILDLKIEETDFEDVIRSFLEKESRVL